MADQMPPAGKLIPRGHGTKECLQSPINEFPPQTADSLKKFRRQTYPNPGERRTQYASVNDHIPDVPHGITSKESIEVSSLVNPQLESAFHKRLHDLKESLYFSNRKAPLGQSHDQSTGLPNGLNPLEKTFGITNQKDCTAGELVSPDNRLTPETELLAAKLYKKSHGDFAVGEKIDRDYDWSTFTHNSLYGVPTPHDNSGSGVRTALKWAKQNNVTKKQLDDFRERTQPQLGQVHDPIVDTLYVHINDDHTFGVTVIPDDYSAGELAHMTGPSSFLQCGSWNTGLLVTIRQHLKKNNFTKFPELLDAFNQAANKASDGKINGETIKEIFYQFHVPLEPDMIELLLAWTTDTEGHVVYDDMIVMMDWRHGVPNEICERANERLIHGPVNVEPSKVVLSNAYRTSSGQVQASVGHIHTNDYRIYGVPAIRSDRPAPKIKRVSDHTNYGDESDAYGLLYPSVYSNHGLYEKDFFTPRSSQEVRQIFEAAGIAISDDAFKSLWEQATSFTPSGQVSIETFRAVLEGIQI